MARACFCGVHHDVLFPQPGRCLGSGRGNDGGHLPTLSFGTCETNVKRRAFKHSTGPAVAESNRALTRADRCAPRGNRTPNPLIKSYSRKNGMRKGEERGEQTSE